MTLSEKDELMKGFKTLNELVEFGINDFEVCVEYVSEHYWTDEDGNEWYSAIVDEEVGTWGFPKDLIKNAEERGYGSYYSGYENIVFTGLYDKSEIRYAYAIFYDEATFNEPYNTESNGYSFFKEPRIIKKKGA